MAVHREGGQSLKPINVLCSPNLVAGVIASLWHQGFDGTVVRILITSSTVDTVHGKMNPEEDEVGSECSEVADDGTIKEDEAFFPDGYAAKTPTPEQAWPLPAVPAWPECFGPAKSGTLAAAAMDAAETQLHNSQCSGGDGEDVAAFIAEDAADTRLHNSQCTGGEDFRLDVSLDGSPDGSQMDGWDHWHADEPQGSQIQLHNSQCSGGDGEGVAALSAEDAADTLLHNLQCTGGEEEGVAALIAENVSEKDKRGSVAGVDFMTGEVTFTDPDGTTWNDIAGDFADRIGHDGADDDTVVEKPSCTTNGLAPVGKVLDDRFEDQHGMTTTAAGDSADYAENGTVGAKPPCTANGLAPGCKVLDVCFEDQHGMATGATGEAASNGMASGCKVLDGCSEADDADNDTAVSKRSRTANGMASACKVLGDCFGDQHGMMAAAAGCAANGTVVSNASCSTNGMASVCKGLGDDFEVQPVEVNQALDRNQRAALLLAQISAQVEDELKQKVQQKVPLTVTEMKAACTLASREARRRAQVMNIQFND